MSWRDAPLYIEAHDLAVWTISRAESWNCQKPSRLGARISKRATDLVCAISLALTFPRTRHRHLRQADETIVELRTELRLPVALGLLSSQQLRFASERLSVIGKMVGGWRKRLRPIAKGDSSIADSANSVSGGGSPAATA